MSRPMDPTSSLHFPGCNADTGVDVDKLEDLSRRSKEAQAKASAKPKGLSKLGAWVRASQGGKAGLKKATEQDKKIHEKHKDAEEKAKSAIAELKGNKT